MTYKIRRAYIANDGTVTYAKRTETIVWPVELRINGLYFLRTNKAYKVEGKKD